jgi:hypothetical protein
VCSTGPSGRDLASDGGADEICPVDTEALVDHEVYLSEVYQASVDLIFSLLSTSAMSGPLLQSKGRRSPGDTL